MFSFAQISRYTVFAGAMLSLLSNISVFTKNHAIFEVYYFECEAKKYGREAKCIQKVAMFIGKQF